MAEGQDNIMIWHEGQDNIICSQYVENNYFSYNKYRMMFSGMVIKFNHATDECCDLLCYALRNIPYVA